ncbi:MAG: VCBS repeat-containing protein [Bacteroidetes bacterium]|nr:MAG: VCBS repeat-containing protein [Bacteroidota bacterium]
MIPLFHFPFASRVRVLSLALTLQWILAATVYSQLQRATLGVATEIRSAKNSQGLVAGDFDGDGLADLASYNERQVLIEFQTKDSTLWYPSDPNLDAGKITKVLAAHCNSDKMSDLIVVDGKASVIRIVLARHGHEFYVHSSIKFKDEIPEILVADVNNDSKNDLLIFGKRESGISVYLGSGGGGFAKSTVWLPQKSFSSVSVIDFNADKFNDLIAVDWLNNELNIAKAFGKMKFSEPTVIRYENEPHLIDAAPMDEDSLPDIVVTFVNSSEIRILTGNNSGQFDNHSTFYARTPADRLFLADMNSDGTNDILLFSLEMHGLTIFLNEATRMVSQPEEFSCGRDPHEIVLFPHQKTNLMNIAFVEKGSSIIRIFHNNSVSLSMPSEIAYAIGRGAGSVLSFDMIGNNRVDVAVLEKQSQAISFFPNQENGMLNGKFSIPVSIEGVNMQYAIKNGEKSYFIVTNPTGDAVAVTEFNSKTYEHTSYTVPVPNNSELLLRYVDKTSKMLNFFLLSGDQNTKQTSIARFTQIAPTRFIEQTIISRFEPPLVSATIGDFDNDNDYDIAFLGKNAGRGMLELRTIIRDESSKTLQPHLDFAMKMQEFPHVLMWNADITGDGYPDLIFNLLQPINQLQIALSGSNQKFQEPKFRLRIPVNVKSRSQLKLVDVNGDKRTDIVLNNSLTKEIQVFWGAGNGTFPTVNRLIGSEGVGGFTLADLDNDNFQELIVSDSLNGLLKIFPLK